ncbi:MAG: hypothetical protein GX856_00530 [Gammaproteobacteria bacterium]|nr:hypothetical protein [Gammaproteobacteria bacterium]
MKTYTIGWFIEIDAESPEHAALLALQIQRDPLSLATVFSVQDETGDIRNVDVQPDPTTTTH